MDELDKMIETAIHKYCEEEFGNLEIDEIDEHTFSEEFQEKLKELFPFLKDKNQKEVLW